MKIAVIGGGAAGLMAAATILESDPTAEIFLIEHNDGLGKKVIISGGGRCNVTTGIRDVRAILTKYPRGNKFLSSVMHQFSPQDVYEWFEAHGVPLKTEEDLRVFPQSDNGRDIVGVFERLFHTSNVHVLLKAHAVRVHKNSDGFEIFLKNSEDPLRADKLVLTTGGQAYRQTGSTGDGYAFAMSLGHAITPLAPSLNAFFTRETWPAQISGLSFARARIAAKREGMPSFTGPFLFTHKGVSGPAVFALSSLVAFETCDATQPLEISIDLFPDASSEELQEKMHSAISANPRRSWLNALSALVPKSLAEIACLQLRLAADRRAGEVSKKEILDTASWLKAIPLHVVARGAGDEFVTAGGVELKEVDPSTMESKICPGLYFAGEILNVDGFTGGFNLQASWATGRLAGRSAAVHE
ncbi:NAD(P)/FAD-dependent oxidoreductase [Candidatus Uhrbacteria bacterium]|nr:NAD(P)/FAD-dependent oxidoreductase [Candidatus Uhrbacteria bacterium]